MRNILLLLTSFFSAILYSQIGIYTEHPLGVFHIDSRNNTTQAGVNIGDDIVVSVQGNIGMGMLPVGNASLAFGDNLSKGFELPKVALTAATDNTTIPVSGGNVDRGMIVYHTGGNGMTAGLKSWNGTSWEPYLVSHPLQISLMQSDVEIVRAPEGVMTTLNDLLPYSDLVVPETGGYYIEVRQLLNVNTLDVLTGNSTVDYRLDLINVASGALIERYSGSTNLYNNNTGGRTIVINFTFHGNFTAGTRLGLRGNTRFNVAQAEYIKFNATIWERTYSVEVPSRMVLLRSN